VRWPAAHAPRLLVLLLLVLATGCRAGVDPPAGGFKAGIALPEIHPGHGGRPYDRALEAIRGLEARWVLLPVYGYMDSAAAPGIDTSWEPPWSAGDYQRFVRRLVRKAHAEGLSVLIVPYVNLREDSRTDWRGNIRPGDWPAWFASYESFLERWVELARDENVAMFAVGAELVSSEERTAEWQNLIASVRRQYPGRLIYSFNWDHYEPAQFHHHLDAIGISGYFSLDPEVELSEAALVANWLDVKNRLMEFSRRVERPFLFTEIGCPSVAGAARNPWDYFQEGPPDPRGQAEALSAFIRAWDGTPELDGVFIWNYSPVRGGADDTSYSIKGKPAEQIVKAWYSKMKTADAAD
jgi:hypothetical protein